ncbi:MAG: amidohydrolase family protein [Bacteroidia bacterium]|nr:amidohydrolase family protein [Bacteroidia bacterium]
MKSLVLALVIPSALLLISACGKEEFDVVIRGGTLYDGSGSAPVVADLAIDGDRIAAVGDLSGHAGRAEIDASGLAVAPGFINMLSWANESLIQDGRSLSDIRQGVTLEVMGEGNSMGPLNETMRQEMVDRQSDIEFDVSWTTLGEYLQHLEDRGISTNVASFVGAATVRIHEMGYEDRDPTPEELDSMLQLVRDAMQEGAMGVGSSLPYIPAPFASTEELIALAKVAADHDGMYISHIRNEADDIFEALEEFLTIVREAGVRGEIYHLKVSHKRNWDKLDEVVALIEGARAEGLDVTADIYTYHASSTGLNYDLPSWVKEGDHEERTARLEDPEVRERVIAETEMIPPEDILLVSFRNEDLRHLTGKTLAEVAEMRGTSPVVTTMDLIVEDDSRIGTVRFTMNEDNIRQKIALPWVSICSDSASLAPEPPFTNSQPHPRAYGSFARLLGKYVREEGIITLEEAIHRLTGLPASNLELAGRGTLAPDYFADVVVFDPETVIDRATFEEPHQLATGVVHVFVNGEQVLRDGEHTGATPGRFVRGPGWVGSD